MVSTAYSVLHNAEDAEDTVHNTFIKIAQNMKAIDDPKSAKTLSYVIKATKNNAINLLNKNTAKSEAEFGDEIKDIPDEDFFEKLDIEESYKEVVEAIQALGDTYRDVMFYHFVCDMKIKDIATLLGKKNSAVKQQLIRGKKKLLEELNRN